MAIFGPLAEGFELSEDYPTVKPSLNIDFAATRSMGPRAKFLRTSIGTYVDKDGLVKTATHHEPRFDHDPDTLESLGLLLEDSRTNLIAYSVINTANWNNSASQLLNNTSETTAPDGTNTACKYIPNNGSIGWVSVYNTANPVSLTSGTKYAYSVWAKPTHSDYTGFRINGDIRDGGGIDISANFVLSGDGSVSGTYDSAYITKYPNGWYRCVATGTSDATTTEEPGFQTTTNGDGTKGFYVWGYQVEINAEASSYIPTSGAAVTRQPDYGFITGLEFSRWFNQSEGTLDVAYKIGSRLSNMRVCQISNSGGDSVIDLVAGSGGGAGGYWFINNSNGVQFSSTGVTNSNITNRKFRSVLAYKTDDCAAQQNNITAGPTTDSTCELTKDMSRLLMYQVSNGGDHINGHLKFIRYYPKRITNAQVTLLSQENF